MGEWTGGILFPLKAPSLPPSALLPSLFTPTPCLLLAPLPSPVPCLLSPFLSLPPPCPPLRYRFIILYGKHRNLALTVHRFHRKRLSLAQNAHEFLIHVIRKFSQAEKK